MGGLNNDINNLKIDTQVFKDVSFFLNGNIDKQIEELLCSHGGTKIQYLSDFVTHYIFGDDVPDAIIFDAEDTFDLAAINAHWVEACVSLNKLVDTRPYRRSKHTLFNSLVFCIARTSKKDLSALWSLITFYGGRVKLKLDAKCTHLICGLAKGTRYTTAVSLGAEKLNIVTPDWILDSINANSLCPTTTYHPRLLIIDNGIAENDLRNITGFDFEESLAKTEVPTQVSSVKEVENKCNQKLTFSIAEQLAMPMTSHGFTLINNQSNLPLVSNANLKFSQPGIHNPNLQIQNQHVHQQIQNSQAMIINQQNAINQQIIAKSNFGQQKIQSMQNNSMQDEDWKERIISQHTSNKTMSGTHQIVVSTGQNQTLNNVQQMHQKQQMNLNMNNQMAVTQSGNQVISQNIQVSLNQQQNLAGNQQVINKQQLSNNHLINNTSINQGLNLNSQQMSELQNSQILLAQQNKVMNNQLQINNQQIQMSQQNNMHQINNQHIITTSQQPNQQLNSSPINQQQSQQIFKAQQTIQNQQIVNQQGLQNSQLINMQQNQQIVNQQMLNQNQLLNNQRVDSQVLTQQNIQIIGQQPQNVQNQPILQQQNQQLISQPQNPQVWQHQQQYAVTNVQQQQQRQPAPRPIWQQQIAQPGQQRQLIHLDAHTHAQLQQMDPQQRAQFVAHLQKQQRALMQKQQQQQQAGLVQRPGAPPRPGQIAVIRSQVPAGLTPQQQIQWVQQQQQQGAVRPAQQVTGSVVVGGAPGLSPISQQQQSPTAFALDQNAASQQHMQQLQIQRQQQYHRLKQLQMQREQAQKQGSTGMPLVSNTVLRGQPTSAVQGFVNDGETPPVVVAVDQQQNQPQPPTQAVVVNSKTKTALANMITNRLQSGCNAVVVPGADQEPSAAGTLRMMTAQHNASLNAPVAPRTQQELLVLQQQRRTGIGVAAPVAMPVAGGAGQVAVMPGGGAAGQVTVMSGATGVLGQTNGTALKPGMVFANGRLQVQPPRPQFYGHNPNLKLPPDLFLLGCIFLIVEYDEEDPNKVTEWKKIIAKHGGEVEPSYCARVTHLLCKTQRHGLVMQAIRDVKRCVTAHWLSDTMIKRQVLPPWQAIHLPAFGTQKPAFKHIITYTGFENEERIRVREMIEETGAKFTGYLSKHNTVVVCKRAEGKKYKSARERGTSVVNVAWLSDILLGNLDALKQLDSPKYQQYNLPTPFRLDYTLVPHLMGGWKSPINITQESHERVKRSLSPHTGAPRAKRPRTLSPDPPFNLEPNDAPVQIISKNPPSIEDAPRVLFSLLGDELQKYVKIVKQLGGLIVNSAADASHLVLGLPCRSSKLLMCLIVCRYIITPQWLIESEQCNEFLPCDKYIFRDERFHKVFNCDIEKVLLKPDRSQLFKNKIFYLTNSVAPPRKFLTKLIEAAGGVVERNKRSCIQVQDLQSVNPNGYVVITTPGDLHLVTDLIYSTKITKCVFNSEFVMSSIMTQTINFEENVVIIK